MVQKLAFEFFDFLRLITKKSAPEQDVRKLIESTLEHEKKDLKGQEENLSSIAKSFGLELV